MCIYTNLSLWYYNWNLKRCVSDHPTILAKRSVSDHGWIRAKLIVSEIKIFISLPQSMNFKNIKYFQSWLNIIFNIYPCPFFPDLSGCACRFHLQRAGNRWHQTRAVMSTYFPDSLSFSGMQWVLDSWRIVIDTSFLSILCLLHVLPFLCLVIIRCYFLAT